MLRPFAYQYLATPSPLGSASTYDVRTWVGPAATALFRDFGLMVWPDASPGWKDVDEYPDTRARNVAWEVYDRASKLDAVAIGRHQRRLR